MHQDELFNAVTYTHVNLSGTKRGYGGLSLSREIEGQSCLMDSADRGVMKIDQFEPHDQKRATKKYLNRFLPHSDDAGNLSADNSKNKFGNFFVQLSAFHYGTCLRPPACSCSQVQASDICLLTGFVYSAPAWHWFLSDPSPLTHFQLLKIS